MPRAPPLGGHTEPWAEPPIPRRLGGGRSKEMGGQRRPECPGLVLGLSEPHPVTTSPPGLMSHLLSPPPPKMDRPRVPSGSYCLHCITETSGY